MTVPRNHHSPRRVANFDPAFRPAVAAGCLTVQQAVQRGNRQAYATRLARKHGISMARALDVADNRMRLGEVVRLAEEARAAAARRPRRPTATASKAARRRPGVRPWQVAVMVVSLAGLAVAGRVGVARWNAEKEASRQVGALAAATAERSAAAEPSETPDPAKVAAHNVDVEKNGMGMISRIAGPDPQSVLNAYCGAFAGLQPVGLADTVPPFNGSRLGVFRDLNEPGEHSILIRHDQRSGRWRAGDGANPITPRPVEWPVKLHATR